MKVMNKFYLVVSDIHLGALFSKPKLFKRFLKKIKKKKNRVNLKGIFVLGDFLDLCVDTPEHLIKSYKYIYKIMNYFYKKEIPIYLTLGNHEIPLNDREYETKFSDSKGEFLDNDNDKEMIKKFKDKYKFFNANNIYQYFVLSKKKNCEPIVLCFDSKQEIEIREEEGENEFNILLTHGHQFEPIDKLMVEAAFWEAAIAGDNVIKTLFNAGWYGVIKKYLNLSEIIVATIDVVVNKKKEIIDAIIDVVVNKKKYIKKLNENNLTAEDFKKFCDLVKEIENRRYQLDNLNFNNFIIDKFLNQNLTEISHIIYGHTHSFEKFEKNNKMIINTGAWQHEVRPTFAKVYLDGTVEIIECKKINFWKIEFVVI